MDQAQHAPWHPGRCAVLLARTSGIVGHAGELHPKVLEALGLPPRTCAMELDLDALLPATEVAGRRGAAWSRRSRWPTVDVALVVAARGAGRGRARRRCVEGAGPLLESIRLFDVYEGDRVGGGSKSLAFSLRFRAADRTLKADEVAAVREAAVASRGTRHTGAVLRG